MDRGRQIYNSQNVNAVNIDKFGNTGKTSTRVINPPGGKDHFSLGWGDNNKEEEKPKYGRKRFDQFQNSNQQDNNNINPNQNKNTGVHTSVKVSHRPGGQSSIVFGTDDTNYDHYRK